MLQHSGVRNHRGLYALWCLREVPSSEVEIDHIGCGIILNPCDQRSFRQIQLLAEIL